MDASPNPNTPPGPDHSWRRCNPRLIGLGYFPIRALRLLTYVTAITLFDFIAQGLILGSVFLNMPNATVAYFSRGSALFFSIFFSAVSSVAEIPSLFTQRPIITRHHHAALYHPFIDALAITIVDIVGFISWLFEIYN